MQIARMRSLFMADSVCRKKRVGRMQCAFFLRGRSALQGQHGDVVFLTEGDCRFSGFGGAGIGGKERVETLEAVEFATGSARFKETVGVEGEAITLAQLDGSFVVVRRGNEAEGNGAGQIQFHCR